LLALTVVKTCLVEAGFAKNVASCSAADVMRKERILLEEQAVLAVAVPTLSQSAPSKT